MTPAEYIQIFVAIGAVLGAVGKSVQWLVALVTNQSKETISDLKEDRDYWKDRAQTCEKKEDRT